MERGSATATILHECERERCETLALPRAGTSGICFFFLEEAVTSIANEASGLKCKLRLRARSGILGDKKIGKGNGSFKLNWIVVRTLVVYFEFMLFL